MVDSFLSHRPLCPCSLSATCRTPHFSSSEVASVVQKSVRAPRTDSLMNSNKMEQRADFRLHCAKTTGAASRPPKPHADTSSRMSSRRRGVPDELSTAAARPTVFPGMGGSGPGPRQSAARLIFRGEGSGFGPLACQSSAPGLRVV